MASGVRDQVDTLGRDISRLLRGLDPSQLQLKPNSYEPTAAESLALALLELDRIGSDTRPQARQLPAFASDFLNRKLTKRLLDRYRGRALAAEFERRLDDVLGRIGEGTGLNRVHDLLTDLELALLQRQSTQSTKG